MHATTSFDCCKLYSPLNLLLKHAILVRAACGSNVCQCLPPVCWSRSVTPYKE